MSEDTTPNGTGGHTVEQKLAAASEAVNRASRREQIVREELAEEKSHIRRLLRLLDRARADRDEARDEAEEAGRLQTALTDAEATIANLQSAEQWRLRLHRMTTTRRWLVAASIAGAFVAGAAAIKYSGELVKFAEYATRQNFRSPEPFPKAYEQGFAVIVNGKRYECSMAYTSNSVHRGTLKEAGVRQYTVTLPPDTSSYRFIGSELEDALEKRALEYHESLQPPGREKTIGVIATDYKRDDGLGLDMVSVTFTVEWVRDNYPTGREYVIANDDVIGATVEEIDSIGERYLVTLDRLVDISNGRSSLSSSAVNAIERFQETREEEIRGNRRANFHYEFGRGRHMVKAIVVDFD